MLHLFKGTVTNADGLPGIGVDINPQFRPEIVGDAQRIPIVSGAISLTVADTPYGPVHAKRYGFPMPDRKKVMHEVARITRPGGHLVWLDTKKPMFKKTEWHQYGTIGVERSTNHDIRGVWLFERV